MADFIIVMVVMAIVGGASAYIIKAKKSGAKCIGCPSGGACAGCHAAEHMGEGCDCGCQSEK